LGDVPQEGLSHVWIHRSFKIEKNPAYLQRSALTGRLIKSNPSFMLENGKDQVNLEEALDLSLLMPFNPLSLKNPKGDVGGRHRIIAY
jgi:hypothetical protein